MQSINFQYHKIELPCQHCKLNLIKQSLMILNNNCSYFEYITHKSLGLQEILEVGIFDDKSYLSNKR